MKTTIYIQDDIYRMAKAQAALDGKSLRGFIEEALAAALARSRAQQLSANHWLDELPPLSPGVAEEVDSYVSNDAFRSIDTDMWQ